MFGGGLEVRGERNEEGDGGMKGWGRQSVGGEAVEQEQVILG